MQSSLHPSKKNRVLLQVMNWPETSGLVGVLGKKLIHFVHFKENSELFVNSV